MHTNLLKQDVIALMTPIPEWVRMESFNSNENDGDHFFREYDGLPIEWLLEDYQFNLVEKTTFRHIVYRFKSQNGIQENSTLTFSYDPQYQKPALHVLKVIRDGQAVDKSEEAQFRVFQKEPGINQHLYDGILSFCIFLEDMREGDIIEYAYSIHSFKSIHDDHFSNFFHIQYEVPLQKQLIRILSNKDHQLNYATYESENEIIPQILELDSDLKEWRWLQNCVKEYHFEEEKPSHYVPSPVLHVSDYNNWNEVVQAQTKFFPKPDLAAATTEMQRLVQSWLQESKEGQVLSALRFVQDKIRYLGLEEGINAYQACDPILVFEKRFGDCKGKTQLLRILLAMLGFDSYPVLVNVDIQRGIGQFLPSHNVFNHVILKVQIDDKVFWLDPTTSHQGGSLDQSSCHVVELGLILEKSESSLTSIPFIQAVRTECLMKIVIDNSLHGTAEIELNYFDQEANYFRQYYTSHSLQDLTKTFYAWLTEFYHSVDPMTNMEIDDNRELNQIKFQGKCKIKNFVEISEKPRQETFSIHALKLRKRFTRNFQLDRLTPLQHVFPCVIRETVEISCQEADWENSQDHLSIKNDVFNYDVSLKTEPKRVIFNFNYVSLQDSVPIDQLEQYQKDIKRALDLSSLNIKITKKRFKFIRSWFSKIFDFGCKHPWKIGISYAVLRAIFRIIQGG